MALRGSGVVGSPTHPHGPPELPKQPHPLQHRQADPATVSAGAHGSANAPVSALAPAPASPEFLSKVSRTRTLEMSLVDEPSVPAFLLKLYTMLEDLEAGAISWSDEGETFVVSDPTVFAKDVLPQYFKHNNYASFIRQLNLYGFHKLKQAPTWHEFAHPLFKRGKKDLLKGIKRKTPGKKYERNGSFHATTMAQTQPPSISHPSPSASPTLFNAQNFGVGNVPFDGRDSGREWDQRVALLEQQYQMLTGEVHRLTGELGLITSRQEKMRMQMQQMFSVVMQVLSSENLEQQPNHANPMFRSPAHATLAHLRHSVESVDSSMSQTTSQTSMKPMAIDSTSQMCDTLVKSVGKRNTRSSAPLGSTRVTSRQHPSIPTSSPRMTMPALDPSLDLGAAERDHGTEEGTLEDFDSWQRLNETSKNDQAEYLKLISDFEAQLSDTRGPIPDYLPEFLDTTLEAGHN